MYNKLNYERNKAAHRIRQKRYRDRNIEKCKLRAKKHYIQNKEIINNKRRARYLNNKESELAQTGARKKFLRRTSYVYTQKCFKAHQSYVFRTKYGITLDDYTQLLDSQSGKCAICGRPDPGRKGVKYFAVDHDHETGKVRGLLCARCNCALGSFQDNIGLLTAAVAYLSRHKGTVTA